MRRMSALLAALAVCATSVSAAFPAAPLYKQCNTSWGSDQMGVSGPGERSTICGEGCAMSSLSMALAAYGITINGLAANPQVFNNWLKANQGYMCAAGDCNNLVLDAPSRVSPRVQLVGEVPKPPAAVIRAGLNGGQIIYLAHVHNSGHFVLLTGIDTTTTDSFTVNDPFYASTTYPYANISDIIIYSVAPASQHLRTPTKYTPAANAPIAVNRHGVVRASTILRSAVIPKAYPLYKQCDPRWGSHLIVSETICEVGCLMSSTSMAIAGHNISINHALSTPDTLNTFLQQNGGYTSGNDMEESVVPQVNTKYISWPSSGMHPKNDIPIATIQSLLRAGQPVIANVMAGRHFVLVVGWDASDSDTLYINDPGFDRDTYSYSNDVVGWRLFTMSECKQYC